MAVAASYDVDAELRQRIRCITRERGYLHRRLRAIGIYTTDAHANFVYLRAAGGPGAKFSKPPVCRRATTSTGQCAVAKAAESARCAV